VDSGRDSRDTDVHAARRGRSGRDEVLETASRGHRVSYLGSITRWPNGQRITLVVLRAEAEAQRTFLKRVVQMTDIDYSQHWLGEVFRGRASGPPHVAASAAEAVRFVAGHPNAIGFVSMEAVDASVSLLNVDGKSAEAEDYPLAW
jgi:hypothetical protein